MAVPLLELVTQNNQFVDEIVEEFREFIGKGQYILGDYVTHFEEKVAKHLGVNHAIGVSSGTDALVLALMALDIQPGDEVLCPSFSFFATAGCISRLGAIPIFIDVDRDSFNLNLEDARNKLTNKTKAIIPVHLFGQSCSMSSLLDFAKQNNLKVIEDTAQSLGSKYQDSFAGTLSDYGCYSFFPSKNLGSIGDAGLVVTNNLELAERAKIFRLHGSQPKYYHKWIGGNFRIDALHAMFLTKKLDSISSYEDARARNAAYYSNCLLADGRFGENQGQSFENESKSVLVPMDLKMGKHVWNQFTLRIGQGKRDELWNHLKSNGIGAEVYYPVSLHKQECFKNLLPSSCPVSEEIAGEVLSIPVYPELTVEQMDEVIQTLLEFTY